MTKKAVMISIDHSVHEMAKDKGLRISSICEDALRQIVNTFDKETLPENCKHKWTWPFSLPSGLAKECVRCGTISKVKMETYEETMESANAV